MFFQIKFHISSSDVSLVSIFKLEVKFIFQVAAMSFFYILQKKSS